jgi:hypothetical protein
MEWHSLLESTILILTDEMHLHRRTGLIDIKLAFDSDAMYMLSHAAGSCVGRVGLFLLGYF